MSPVQPEKPIVALSLGLTHEVSASADSISSIIRAITVHERETLDEHLSTCPTLNRLASLVFKTSFIRTEAFTNFHIRKVKKGLIPDVTLSSSSRRPLVKSLQPDDSVASWRQQRVEKLHERAEP